MLILPPGSFAVSPTVAIVNRISLSVPKSPMKVSPKAYVSLFSGAGGLDLGLERAGWRTAYASDNDANAVETLLRERGYEPYADGPGVLRLRNCPFHSVAQRQPEVICEMNLALLRGVVEELGDPALTAALEPAPGRCCVALRHAANPRR